METNMHIQIDEISPGGLEFQTFMHVAPTT